MNKYRIEHVLTNNIPTHYAVMYILCIILNVDSFEKLKKKKNKKKRQENRQKCIKNANLQRKITFEIGRIKRGKK